MNACLIMGHKNPLQIVRLAKKLMNNKNDVFIHLDSNMSEIDSEYVKAFSIENDCVYFCNNRIHGVLDKRSLVDIVFLMINAAKLVEKEAGKSYKYYLLFSGQDYPIKNIGFINEQLDYTYPQPYIDCTPYDKNNWIYHKFKFSKSSLSYHNWISDHFAKGGLLRKGFRLVAVIYERALSILGKDTYHVLNKMGVSLYGGSAWWILPDIIINYILEKYITKDIISEMILNESVTPEETFFQTMAKRSPLSDLIETNPIDMVLQNCKTWAYFFDDDKPFVGHPYIFTINEIDRLQHSKFWFARKFDMTIDSNVMDKLDLIIEDSKS